MQRNNPCFRALRMGVVMCASVIMAVIVIMTVKRKRALRAASEQRAIFGGGGDNLRRALTADVAIQTNHTVRRAHHHV